MNLSYVSLCTVMDKLIKYIKKLKDNKCDQITVAFSISNSENEAMPSLCRNERALRQCTEAVFHAHMQFKGKRCSSTH